MEHYSRAMRIMAIKIGKIYKKNNFCSSKMCIIRQGSSRWQEGWESFSNFAKAFSALKSYILIGYTVEEKAKEE